MRCILSRPHIYRNVFHAAAGSPEDRFESHDHLESTDSKYAYLKFVKAGYDRKILMYGYDKSISNNKGRAIDIIHTVSGADLY